MKRPLVFRREVRNEVDEAYAWYENRSPGLGDAYLAEIQVCLDRIQANPEIHAPVLREVRRSLIKRFSSAVYYRVEPARIEVIAFIHGKRDPERWRKRV